MKTLSHQKKATSRWTFLAALILAQSVAGCAIHYADRRGGMEHLWGFGQLRLESESAGNGLAAITTGVRVPGLCLEVGRDHFGVSFGFLNRQQLAVVNTSATNDLATPSVSPGVRVVGDNHAPWAFGHLRMRGVAAPAHHYAIVTGKALAGLGAGVGGQDTNLRAGLDGRQQAVVLDENIHLDFDQTAPRWPGFNLFATKVSSFSAKNDNQPNKQGNP